VYPPVTLIVGASTVEALTEATAAQQQAYYEAARLAVDNFCNQSFDKEEGATITVAGGGTILALPRRLAVLTSLDGGLDPAAVALGPEHDQLTLTASAGATWVERALAETAITRFPAQVAVTGTWGFTDAEMPEDDPDSILALALRFDMEEQAEADVNQIAQTARVAERLGLAQLGEGGMAVAFGGPALPLAARSQALLERHIWAPTAAVA
jgi:hypothetical protein